MQVVNGVIHRTVNGVLLNQFQIPSPGVSPMQNSESTDAVRPSKALPLPQQHSQSLPANLSCVSRKCRKECVSCAANSLVFLLCCCCFVTTAQQTLSFLAGSDEDSLSVGSEPCSPGYATIGQRRDSTAGYLAFGAHSGCSTALNLPAAT